MSERGPALVRIALLSLVFGAFALALVQPAQAGTEEVPEIQDPAADHEVLGSLPPCAPPGSNCQSTGADILGVWISDETATDFKVNMKYSGAPASSNQYANVWAFTATFSGTAFTASATSAGGAAPSGPTAAGVATAATVEGNTLTLTVPKSALGTVAAGASMTDLMASTSRSLFGGGPALISDDAGPGTDYIFTGGSGTPTVPGDSDGDQLNDTCELEFYDDLNGTNNATADDDGDGLTNGQECAMVPPTDPTDSDTDNDGVNDKDDPFPTDATKGGTTSGSGSTSGTRSSSTSRSSSSGAGSGSDTGSGTSAKAGEVRNLDDAVEKLQSDLDYLGMSGGGMVAVLLLAILALAVRWSL